MFQCVGGPGYVDTTCMKCVCVRMCVGVCVENNVTKKTSKKKRKERIFARNDPACILDEKD